jgi:hypothetical protein
MAVYIQGLYTVYNSVGVRSIVVVLGLAMNQGRRQPPQGSPLSTGLGRRADEVKGRSSQEVSTGVAETAFVEVAKELPTWGMQKPPCGEGEKPFPSKFSATPAVMGKQPADLKTRPAWWQLECLGERRPAWPSRLGRAVCYGIVGCHAWIPRPCTP